MKRKTAILLAGILALQGIAPAAAEELAADAAAAEAIVTELAEEAPEEPGTETAQDETAALEPDMVETVTEAADAAAEPAADTVAEPADENSAEQTTEQGQEAETSADGAEELIIEPDCTDTESADAALPEVSAIAAGSVPIDAAHFPDEAFREYVKDFDQNGNGILSESERREVTNINISFRHILDLSGIEYFTALTNLGCFMAGLESLDVSKNTALTVLNCDNCNLESLDVSKNTALTTLSCSENHALTSLDVSKNTALTTLYCDECPLRNLDVSKNILLTELSCGDNLLENLDVSKNTALTILACGGNRLEKLDVSKNTALERLNCSDNYLEDLDVSKNILLTYLSCKYNLLKNLDASNNTLLTYLYCNDNLLKNLDVSNNTMLDVLYCLNNNLTSLDVSNNIKLTDLYCQNNQLTSLDVSKNTALMSLVCGNNQLTRLDLGMFSNTYVVASPQVRTVQLKDTGENLTLDLAELVGADNLAKISCDFKIGENGTMTFRKDSWPGTLSYSYNTGYAKTDHMDVTLNLNYAHEHNYKKVTKAATCTEEGYSCEECSICHQAKEGSKKTTPALGHTGGTATCVKKAVCTRCGQSYGNLGTVHTYGKYVVTKQPTVLAEGVQTRTCTGCGAKENKSMPKLTPTVKLSATSVTLKAKQSTKVKVSALALGDAVTSWKSSDTSIATVNKKGKITAKSKAGKATVTVTLKSGLSKKITVTVQKAAVACTSVTLNKKSLTLKKGKTFTLKATVKPPACTQKATYTTSNKSVATVNSKGKITAKKKGTVTITVTVGKKKATCKVKVVK